MGQLRMVPMASLPPFQARVLAARLGAEGILWQLRGESSVYPFAAVDVLVEADEVDRARELIRPSVPMPLDAVPYEGPPAGPLLDGAAGDGVFVPPRRATAVWAWLVIAAVLAGLALRISHLG
jgi:hypothetical protein